MNNNITIFTTGLLTGMLLILFLILLLSYTNTEYPTNNNPLTGLIIQEQEQKNTPTPKDRINKKHIKTYKDKIIIEIQDTSISQYANTGSMKPTLDAGANGIRIKPLNEQDITTGDLVSFKNNEGKMIIHRVTEIGEDNKGIYYTTKGDNNNINDKEKIRYEDIEYITIGVLW